MKHKVLFLFEHTGLAAKAFTEAGVETYAVDILNEGTNPYVTHYINGDVLKLEPDLIKIARECLFVFGFPPCTDLSVAGARHFEAKATANIKFLADAVYLARSVERIGSAARVAWAAENPVSLLSTLWRKPDYTFHPCFYGGYLSQNDIHPLWPQYIAPRDAYGKTTNLWTGNDFMIPPQKFIAPQVNRYANKQTEKLGGKSQKTKTIRSASPRGFFLALKEIYLENN